MTKKEAYDFLSMGIDISRMQISGDAEYIGEYFKAECIAIGSLEKQIPKKLKATSTRRCPNCSKRIGGIGNLHRQFKFCRWCG